MKVSDLTTSKPVPIESVPVGATFRDANGNWWLKVDPKGLAGELCTLGGGRLACRLIDGVLMALPAAQAVLVAEDASLVINKLKA